MKWLALAFALLAGCAGELEGVYGVTLDSDSSQCDEGSDSSGGEEFIKLEERDAGYVFLYCNEDRETCFESLSLGVPLGEQTSTGWRGERLGATDHGATCLVSDQVVTATLRDRMLTYDSMVYAAETTETPCTIDAAMQMRGSLPCSERRVIEALRL